MEPIQLMVKTSAWPFFFHVKTYIYPSSRYRQFLEEQKADDKKKRKGGSMNEVVQNKALLESEKRKVTSFENNIEKVSGEADLLALKAQRQSKLDLLAESNLKRS